MAVVEGNGGAKAASFTISLNAPAPVGGVSFDVATRDLRGTGNAAQAGVDYVAASESGRSIASGQASASFVVKILGDTKVETYTAPVEAVTSETGKFLVPAMRINGFNFSSVTRF